MTLTVSSQDGKEVSFDIVKQLLEKAAAEEFLSWRR